MTSAVERLERIAEEFASSGRFRPEELALEDRDLPVLVRMRGNPVRFLAKMFDDDWAVRGVHPDPGEIRALRVLVDNAGITRIILRQGPCLYVFSTVIDRGAHD